MLKFLKIEKLKKKLFKKFGNLDFLNIYENFIISIYFIFFKLDFFYFEFSENFEYFENLDYFENLEYFENLDFF